MERRKLLSAVQSRPITFVPKRHVVAVLPGEWSSPYEGKGYELLRCRDFQIGDDFRRISASATARRGIETIVERVALREFKVMVIVDGSPSLRLRKKAEIQLQAAALLLYSAWQAETTFGLGVEVDARVFSFGMGIGMRHFYRLYRALWNISEGKLVKGTNLPLSHCLPVNAMLLYCSDFLDERGDLVNLEELTRAFRRFDFVPIVIQDELEYSFPDVTRRGLVPLANPETGACEEAWISPETANQIRAAHEARFHELVGTLNRRGTNPVHLETADIVSISRQIDRYFRRR